MFAVRDLLVLWKSYCYVVGIWVVVKETCDGKPLVQGSHSTTKIRL